MPVRFVLGDQELACPVCFVDGSADVSEVFLEALVPLLAGAPFADYLGIEAGYRFSDYEFSGAADNWKVGLDWSPVPTIRFRTMAQRAIRAPNINELFREPIQQLTRFVDGVDQCSASANPAGNGLTELCIAQGIAPEQIGIYEQQPDFPYTLFTNGGNIRLDPETADTLTVGFVYQPAWLPALSLSLDYYDIDIEDAIDAVNPNAALLLCFDANDIASAFCRSIVRGPSGDIVELTNPQFNLARTGAKGVDLTANYRTGLDPAFSLFADASISLQVLLNHAMETTLQPTPNGVPSDCAGFYAGACTYRYSFFPVPEFRASTRVTYASGPLSLSLNWQWVGPLDNHLDTTCRETPDFCYPSELGDIGSRNYFELSGRYELGQHWELYGGVSDLFEEDPPLMGFGATLANTAPQLYNVYGRRLFLGFRYRL